MAEKLLHDTKVSCLREWERFPFFATVNVERGLRNVRKSKGAQEAFQHLAIDMFEVVAPNRNDFDAYQLDYWEFLRASHIPQLALVTSHGQAEILYGRS